MARAVSRRQFLIGAGATGGVVVAGGGVAAATHVHGVRRFLHHHGMLGGPDAAVPDVAAEFESSTLDSASMRRAVGYGLYVPAGTVTGALLCLHGRGGTHRDPFDDIGIHKFVASAELPWAVAAVDGGESFWHRRDDGTDAGALVMDELVERVNERAPGARLAVIGWSMGGYGALLLAQQHPDALAAAVASGPSVWHSLGESTPGAFDDAEDFARHDVLRDLPRLRATDTRIDCGEDDPFAGVTREMVQALPGTQGGVHAGFHESPTWRSYLAAQLDFLRERLPS